MRVLVTGAAGMIGRPLTQMLRDAGHDVVPVDPLRPDDAEDGWVQDDLADLDATVRLLARLRVERVAHAGGISGPMVAPKDPYRVFLTNVVASMNLLEAARRGGIGRFVYCSSGAAYGDTEDDPVLETAPLRPMDMYAGTKAMMDTAVAVYRARYGIDVISVRLSHVYGPGRRTDCVIRGMIGDALAGRPTALSWGRGYARPYCYIDDSVEGIIAALLRGPATQAHYNIGGDQMVAIERIAALVRENLPEATITLGQGAPPGATRRNLPSIAAATRDFGYRPKVDISAGIAAYVAWAKAQGGV